MFGPLLSFSLGLVSLFLLVPQPTLGYTVRLLGNGHAFGVKYIEDLDKRGKLPIVNDVVPDLNAATTDELDLEHRGSGKPMANEEIDAYLKKYGYLVIPSNNSVSKKDRENAVKEFQRFSRISATGMVDTRTRTQMQRSRCGVADPVTSNKLANFNAKATRKWGKNDLTYRIVDYTPDLSKAIVKEWTAKSFKMWSDASQLTFTEVESGASDIRVSFTPKIHGDGADFDGPGGVLAHAFYPRNGNIHMDEDETWTVGTKRGINLLFVLVHEIGHALGLGHSEAKNAIMEPYYNGYTPNLALDKDDVAGIQFLYGKPTTNPKPPVTKAPVTKTPTTKRPVTKNPNPTPTNPGPTDAPTPSPKFPCPFLFWSTVSIGNKTYGFYRSYMYEILPNGRFLRGKYIRSIFRGGPKVVGAAAHNDVTGHTFLFLGRRVWRFTNQKLDSGFPKRLKAYVRAAVVIDEQLIAFSFTHVHYLDGDTMVDYVDGEVSFADEYPGLPKAIRAATSYGDGIAYIFYTRRIIQLDMYTGEMTDSKTCPRK